MSVARLCTLILLAMIAFAGNSLLCRIALKSSSIDAASFTTLRLLSGAVSLWLMTTLLSGSRPEGRGNWLSAGALFGYASGFSFAYVTLPAATGALLLFCAVQTTMISHGICQGERLSRVQLGGLMMAFAGVVGLLLPGLTTPPLLGALVMLGAGVSWGVYSLRGRGAGDPVRVTAGNFSRAVPLALVISFVTFNGASLDRVGLWCAVFSGAVASGAGYVLWYSVVPALKATTAATVQLMVPLLTALGGSVFLGETVTVRLVIASVAILGGIALVFLGRHPVESTREGLVGS